MDEGDGDGENVVGLSLFTNITCKPDDQTGFDFDKIESILGYKFVERTLLFTAFTHASKNHLYCNERLEWLGDAILDWIVTRYFFCNGTREMDPRELTEARKSSVSNVSFSEVVVYYQLHKFLRFDNDSLGKEIDKFFTALNKTYQQHSGDVSSPQVFWELCQQDPIPPKPLGDLWEAIAGAILIDLNLDLDKFLPVMTRLMEPFLRRHLDPDSLRTNPISLCLESWNKLGVLRGDILFEEDHSEDVNGSVVVIRVKVRKAIVGEGRAPNRILAKQLAAARAAEFLSANPLLVQEIIKTGGK